MKRKDIERIKSHQFVIIFGAGAVGKKVAAWLTKSGQHNFFYAVSDKRQNPESLDGIAVRQIDEVQSFKGKSIVIVAAMPELHGVMRDKLDHLGFEEKIFADDKFLKTIGIYEVNGIYPTERGKYLEGVNRIAKKICGFLSCKNIIVFESKIDYTDNCRALSEYIAEEMPDKYKIVWVVKNSQKKNDGYKYTYVNRYCLSIPEIIKLNYYLARAKFIFFTHPGWLHEWKSEQKVINLGHGNPFKNADGQPLGHVADCVLASGRDGIKYRKKEYKNDITVEVLGPPRNDWLYENYPDVRKMCTDGKAYRKIIVCFPTYKQYDINLGNIQKIKYDSKETNEFCVNTINSISELKTFNQFLSERNVLLVCKEHYLQRRKFQRSLSNIRYINEENLQTSGCDIYQVLAEADALLTDFSSIFMDFLLLDRPVGFFANSVNQYDRGFTMEQPEKYMPGMKIYNNEDLKNFVDRVIKGNDGYEKEREKTRNLIFEFQDNQNCRRCAEYFEL